MAQPQLRQILPAPAESSYCLGQTTASSRLRVPTRMPALRRSRLQAFDVAAMLSLGLPNLLPTQRRLETPPRTANAGKHSLARIRGKPCEQPGSAITAIRAHVALRTQVCL